MMDVPYSVGVDPAVATGGGSSIAVTVLYPNGKVKSCGVISCDSKVTADDRLLIVGRYFSRAAFQRPKGVCPFPTRPILIVEGQKQVPTQRSSVSALITLAQVAGVIGGALTAVLDPCDYYMPTPGEISKIPKEERHGHLWTLPEYDEDVVRKSALKVALCAEGSCLSPNPITPKERLDVFDSICIARWGQQEWIRRAKRDRFKDQ